MRSARGETNYGPLETDSRCLRAIIVALVIILHILIWSRWGGGGVRFPKKKKHTTINMIHNELDVL